LLNPASAPAGACRVAVGDLQIGIGSAITAPSRRPADKGCRGGGEVLKQHAETPRDRPPVASAAFYQESQMPKMKTKSGAKKRFKVTGTGKVLYQQSRKRHGMIKRTKKQIRQLRGTNVLFKTDGDNIKKYFLPNG
jgi:large subunit ribosomal protein L35